MKVFYLIALAIAPVFARDDTRAPIYQRATDAPSLEKREE